MSELTTQITSVRLARERGRLFAAPVLFTLIAAASVGAGLLVRGPGGISLVGIGVLSAVAAAYLVALISSYRLLVEPGVLRLRWLGGERSYRLVRGSVTRVAVSGENAAALRPRFGALGWAVGPAVLRDDEPIELIRLSRRPPLIVAPTDRGRLAIAAAVESELLAAMTHAVRLQERLDEVAARRAAPPTPEVAPRPTAPPVPRVLTGIERTLIEQRLAAERAASQAAADAERAGAAAEVVPEATEPELAPVPADTSVEPAPRVARRRERTQWQRPAWLSVPGPATVAAAMPIALPLIGAGIAWTAVTVTGRPVLPIDEARILLAALALVGPVGAVGALIARIWYPRLGGLVMISSVAALAMLTRTILA
ncbi:MAG TPA: hypothetical protein VFJ00_00445 [Candidatus Limnocylindria bacterium]|nr:hypothetical protein [Candidatus Limnocylindria bacterium]